MLTAFSRILTARVRPGQRATVEHEQLLDYQAHIHVRADGLAGVITTDKSYQPRVAFGVLAAQSTIVLDVEELRGMFDLVELSCPGNRGGDQIEPCTPG